MTIQEAFLTLRSEMVRIFPGPSSRRRPAAMLIEHGRFTFRGERLTGPRATVVTACGNVEDDKGFAGLGDRLLAALRAETSFRPGREAVALLATDDGEAVRCLMVTAHVGVSSLDSTHDYLVDVGGVRRARIGSVAGTVQEIRPDGSPLHLGYLGRGRCPGREPQLEIPGCIPLDGGIALAASRVPEAVRISKPTQADLLAWSDEHHGTLELRGGPLMAYPAGDGD